MNRDTRTRIIHGMVFYQNQWVPIEEKEQRVKEFRTRVEKGYVQFQGEWMTIDEKIARTSPPPAPAAHAPQQPPQNIYYSPTFNQQTYNVQSTTDNRTFQQYSNEHRHVHVDPNALPPGWPQQQQFPAGQTGPYQALDGQGRPMRAVPPGREPPYMPAQPPPPRLLEQPPPTDAPEYFYGEEDGETGPPYQPRQ
jgi:hypothetical protein